MRTSIAFVLAVSLLGSTSAFAARDARGGTERSKMPLSFRILDRANRVVPAGVVAGVLYTLSTPDPQSQKVAAIATIGGAIGVVAARSVVQLRALSHGMDQASYDMSPPSVRAQYPVRARGRTVTALSQQITESIQATDAPPGPRDPLWQRLGPGSHDRAVAEHARTQQAYTARWGK